MLDHAEFTYRKGRPSCSLCIELKIENNNTPDCQSCGYIELNPDNFLTIGLVERYSGFFIDGNGAVNPQGIMIALELEKIPDEDKPELCQNITLYLNKAMSAQRGT